MQLGGGSNTYVFVQGQWWKFSMTDRPTDRPIQPDHVGNVFDVERRSFHKSPEEMTRKNMIVTVATTDG